jgi:hypothetical protein
MGVAAHPTNIGRTQADKEIRIMGMWRMFTLFISLSEYYAFS